MAIALDTALGATARAGSVTSITQAFNNVAGTYLVVAVATNVNTDTVSGITYAGAAMSRLAAIVAGTDNGESHYIYGLANPATGSNNIIISFTTTLTADFGAASYTGVNTSNATDGTFANNNASSGTATCTETIVTTIDNDWMVATAGLQRSATASTNSTFRSGNPSGCGLFDSGGAITPAGSFAMSQTMGGAGSLDGVAVALQPTGTTTSSHLLTLLSVGI